MATRVLFIRLSALGDVVTTLPAVEVLTRAQPGVRIDWLVEDRFAPLLERFDGIERVLVFPRARLRGAGAARVLLRHVRALREVHYDAAIDFQGNLKGALQLAACRAWRKIGADREASREGAHRFASVRVPVPRGVHRLRRALALLGPLGVADVADPRHPLDPDSLPRPRLRDDPAADALADRLLARVRRGTHPLVFLHPGTSAFGAFKRFPAGAFGAVAAALHEESNADVLVLHGPGEEELAREVERSSHGAARVAPPVPGLRELVSLVRRADLLVAADSGPLHVAAAVGVPTVALFGPKDPAVYAPPFHPSAVLVNDVPCAPCTLRWCADPLCVRGIEPARVVDAALRVLDEAAGLRSG